MNNLAQRITHQAHIKRLQDELLRWRHELDDKREPFWTHYNL
jgi:hypothetical protein